MSGILRNLLAFVISFWSYGSRSPNDTLQRRFWITPFDCGLTVLKSDKYLQLAEAAQVDYLLKTGKMRALLGGGVSFVNLAQLIVFSQPIRVFERVRAETLLLYADDKSAYFCHTFSSNGIQAAKVLVKMKLKKGRITVAPTAFFATRFPDVPPEVQNWTRALDPAGSAPPA